MKFFRCIGRVVAFLTMVALTHSVFALDPVDLPFAYQGFVFNHAFRFMDPQGVSHTCYFENPFHSPITYPTPYYGVESDAMYSPDDSCGGTYLSHNTRLITFTTNPPYCADCGVNIACPLDQNTWSSFDITVPMWWNSQGTNLCDLLYYPGEALYPPKIDNNPPPSISDFVYPVLGISQTDPLQNKQDPLKDGWAGHGVGDYGAASGHLGQDYYLRRKNSAGKPVFAVADGEIVEVLNGPWKYGWCDKRDHGWGPVVVIKHEDPDGFTVTSNTVKDPGNCGTNALPQVIYSLYGHLSKESIKDLKDGQRVVMGQQIGTIGAYGIDQTKWRTNHLHFELKDQVGFKEGSWYTNHRGQCPGAARQACDAQGVGTAYSFKRGFAPHRYVPSVFINDNMLQ